jgi:hypothetical protein
MKNPKKLLSITTSAMSQKLKACSHWVKERKKLRGRNK